MQQILTKLRKIMHNFEINSDFTRYTELFLEENSKCNLISKKDEQFLYEKHIYDSLGIKLFFEKYGIKSAKILDIGCGGGFPCVPIAMEFPDIEITGIDSIRKKINAVQNLQEKLNLNNLDLICDRVENLNSKKYDIIVSRAVADLGKISSYALPLLKKNGYFIAYKSKKAQEEIKTSASAIKKSGGKIIDIIEYTLPLEEIYERNLICIKKLS